MEIATEMPKCWYVKFLALSAPNCPKSLWEGFVTPLSDGTLLPLGEVSEPRQFT